MKIVGSLNPVDLVGINISIPSELDTPDRWFANCFMIVLPEKSRALTYGSMLRVGASHLKGAQMLSRLPLAYLVLNTPLAACPRGISQNHSALVLLPCLPTIFVPGLCLGISR